MSVFDFYRDRAQEYSVQGKSNELMVATRKGKGATVSAVNNDKSALMQDNTAYTNGDLCTNLATNEKYFIVAKENSRDASRCQLKRVNCVIDIVEVKKHFDAKRLNDYDYEVPLHTNVSAFYEDISARMQQYDAGLLSKSTRRFLTPKLDFKLTDRIKFNGKAMMVEDINTSSFQGMLWVQCSPR
jgi:hypothetical protein